MADSGSSVCLEPAGPVQVEEKIQRSLFIARLDPCHDEAEARDLLARARAAHRDATHNCWAYLLGPVPPVAHSSDDGEPSGTAGRPILGALKNGGMMNVMVVVTRYFGGVKLGVRGLIEAYGGVAAQAVGIARPVERVLRRPFMVRLPWSSAGDVTRLLKAHGVPDDGIQWDYGAPDGSVSVRADVPLSLAAPLSRALDELRARGKVVVWSAP